MTHRQDRPKPFGDIEKPHDLVPDSVNDDLGGQPLTLRLGELWSDFARVADECRDPDAPRRSRSVVRLLDDMKGILQWD
jgi:hypothetical protein